MQIWYSQLIYDSEIEYKKYRVKTTIKSFRDLEIYKRTTALSAELFTLKPPDGTHSKHLENELEMLRELPNTCRNILPKVMVIVTAIKRWA